jgi:hypothetical protein
VIDEDFEEAEHTKSARKIFNDLPVVGVMKNDDVKNNHGGASGLDGTKLSDKFKFDYSRGIIHQIFT